MTNPAEPTVAGELYASAAQLRQIAQDTGQDPRLVAALLQRAGELDVEADELERG